MNFNLVIQGPIHSPGFNGNGDKVDYNCIDNINNILEKDGHLFANIVLTTWKGEDLNLIEKNHKNLSILEITDIGGDFRRPSNSFWNTENVKRQFLSTWVGVNFLKNKVNKADIIIKLRTDQSLDFTLLINETKKLIQNKKIIIPCVSKSPFIYPNDYYFVGSAEKMNHFLQSQLLSLSVFMNAHESMIFNYHPEKTFSEKNKILNLVFWGEKERTKHLFKSYSLFSKELISSCYWRGQYVSQFENRLFEPKIPKTFFNWKYIKIKYINIKRFFSSNIIHRKRSIQRLKLLKNIMENKDNKMIKIIQVNK